MAQTPDGTATMPASKEEMQEALNSALTKFDSLDALFSQGLEVRELSERLTEEMQKDLPLAPPRDLQRLAGAHCGRACAAWKFSRGAVTTADTVKKVESTSKTVKQKRPETSGGGTTTTFRPGKNTLPWASIDQYPDYVAHALQNLLDTAERRAAMLLVRCMRSRLRGKDMRVQLAVMSWLRQLLPSFEQEFLERPMYAVSLKYDGTCVGRLDDGTLLGRRTTITPGTFQRTSTAEAERCNAAAFRDALLKATGIPFGRVAVYGELMCNAGFYGYAEKGLHSRWLCFGAVAELPEDADKDAISARLGELNLAHGIDRGSSDESRKIRLLLCPELRKLLSETTSSTVAEEPPLASRSHAGLVEGLASTLIAGEHEGVVIVIPRSGGQASVRKWKNSAEGEGVSKRHAGELQKVLPRLQTLARFGLLDQRVVDMVVTMLEVATADTVKKVQSTNKTVKQKRPEVAKKDRGASAPADTPTDDAALGSPKPATASSTSAGPGSP